MVDARDLLEYWGYTGLFGIVILGNLGLPVPEEGALIFAGYLVWAGQLHLLNVLIVGILGAVFGDNLGYWFGRQYGQNAILRYGHRVFITPARLDKAQRFVARYGSYGVFIARFLPGLRFMSGPIAGSAGMPFLTFFAANLLGGLIYVPLSVGVGYVLGRGFGGTFRAIEHVAGRVEYLALVLLVLTAIVILAWRALNARRVARNTSES
jgi:membrane protein DedA with SNARE-associated domain